MKYCITLNAILLLLLITFNPLSSQTQVGQDIDGEELGDRSGLNVSQSLDGNRIAIGANFNDGNGSEAGHVRVYDLVDGNWTQVGQDINGDESDDNSGRSISLSLDGNRLAIGSNLKDSSDFGHVKVYEWNGENWTQLGIDIEWHPDRIKAGTSITLSSDGSLLAIGSFSSNYSKGLVQVYEWNEISWEQMGNNIDGAAQYDEFGTSISLSSDGNLLAIGAPGNLVGYTQIYEWNEDNWVQLGSNIVGNGNGDLFGFTVSLSSDGRRIGIGAPLNIENEILTGFVRLYEWDGSNWSQMGTDIKAKDEEQDFFGFAVSLSSDGSRVAIGAPLNNVNQENAGLVQLFEWNEEGWLQVGQDIYGEGEEDQSGASVSLSSDGNRLAIGAWLNDGNGIDAGHVRIYDFTLTSNITINEADKLKIYPNPTTGKIRLIGAKDGEIKIIDSFGRVILKKENSDQEIDLSHLQGGIYYVQFTLNNQKVVNKIIKI